MTFDNEETNGYKSESDKAPNDPVESVTCKELMEQLENQINVFENLPPHEKFSFCLNVDLQYFMLISLQIFRKMIQ